MTLKATSTTSLSTSRTSSIGVLKRGNLDIEALKRTSTTSIDGGKPSIDVQDVIKRGPVLWEIRLKQLEDDINDVVYDVRDILKWW